jgi:hypothetical protein
MSWLASIQDGIANLAQVSGDSFDHSFFHSSGNSLVDSDLDSVFHAFVHPFVNWINSDLDSSHPRTDRL